MSNVGGSANINGILYQILGTLDAAVSFKLEAAVTKNDDITQARLIVEPISGGGDVQIDTPGARRVQQWKAKARGGTWSLQKVVDEVLPDLYLAVPDDDLEIDCKYEFITEGKMGKWKEAYEFFHSLSSSLVAEGSLDAIPDSPKRHRLGQVRVSDRGLFQRVLEVIRQRNIGDEPERLTIRKVCHLLQRFLMEAPVNQEILSARVNDFLSHHVELIEEVDNKRRELCGVLLEVAAKGNSTITADSLLRKATIPLHSFRDWPRLRKRLFVRLQSQLEKEQYCQSLDVRPPVAIQENITVVSGESGQGKTWRLARAASNLSEGESLVVWVPSSRGTTDIAAYIAHEIWNYGLEHDRQLTLERVTARKEQSHPAAPAPWAFVFVDDVRSFEEASSLLQLDWSRWGISLLVSTSPDIAERIALDCRHPSVSVLDFRHAELREYVKRREVAWVQIASDVRELIRRPILAKIYADIAEGDAAYRPNTEYDLLDAAWRRISVPVDIGLVRQLASTVIQEDGVYPWPTEYVLEQGGTAEAVERLRRQGWLRDVGDGNVAMWHLRFLYWACAKHLVSRFDSGSLSIEEMSTVLQRCHSQLPPTRFQLGYVPMDVLWLMLAPNRSGLPRADLWQLVAALETHGGHGREDESLYKELLASLGKRVVPVLIDRTRNSGNGKHNVIPKLAAQAMQTIGRHHPETMATALQSCWADSQVATSELGLRLAIAYPGTLDCDQIWEAYRSAIIGDDGRDYSRRRLAAEAFQSVVALHHGWFEQKLKDGDEDQSCFVSLVHTLGDLGGHATMNEIWLATKEHLLREIPSSKRGCLARCIVNFSDIDEYPRLEEWAASDKGDVASWSIWGLSNRHPKRALAVLRSVHGTQLSGITSHIGRAFFAAVPGETCDEIRALIQKRPDDEVLYAYLVSHHGDCLDASTMSLLLDWLTEAVQHSVESAKSGESVSAFRQLHVISKIDGTVPVEELRKRRGSRLEQLILEFACSRIPTISAWTDHEFELARKILKRIAGNGFTRLTNALINAEHRQLRLEGCEMAIVRPDQDTRTLLREESLSDAMWESGSSKTNVVQMRAIDSLAALGENAALVRGILKWGLRVSPYIGEIRQGQSPMSNDEIQAAVDLLEDPQSKQYANAILAIGQSGRSEFQERIESILLDSDYHDIVAQACLLALVDLAASCERILDRLIEQYRSAHYKFCVLKVLGACNVRSEMYARLLPNTSDLDDMDRRVVKFLAGAEETRLMVTAHVRNLIAEGDSPIRDTVDLLDPTCEEDREVLWRKSLEPNWGIDNVGSKARAIKSLGRVAPDAAFEVALESLLTDRRDRNMIPSILAELAPARAVAELCKVAAKTDDKSMCTAIGRAFRQAVAVEQLRAPISDLLSNSHWKCRRAGAHIAGLLGNSVLVEELTQVAYGDPRWDVCATAQEAIRSRQREEEAARLSKSLGSNEPAEIWGTIDCIVQLADPAVLVQANDPFGFLQWLRAQPFVVRNYASKAVSRRKKDLEKEMTSLAGKWNDDS